MERTGLGAGSRSHSPLLAADVMLLHCVAKESSPGASDDPGHPGVHVEGVCEPWVRGGERGTGASGR